MPIVNGEGPREAPTGTQAVLNSKLLILSALEIFEICCIKLLFGSDLLDGGRGIDIYPDVGVGVCRLDCFAAA